MGGMAVSGPFYYELQWGCYPSGQNMGFAYVLLTLRSDPQGRFLFLHAKVNGLELLILAVYIPPPFQFTLPRA